MRRKGMLARSAAASLAVLLSFSTVLLLAAVPSDDPVPQAEIDRQVADCTAPKVGQVTPRRWFEVYCSCIGREAPRLLTATQFRAITRAKVTDQLLEKLGIDRAKVEQMMAGCQREAEPAKDSPVASGSQSVTEAHKIPSDDKEPRGRALFAKLRKAYENLSAERYSRTDFGGIDVTEVVLPYIPIGTSFRDAEALLSEAGFAIEPHPDMFSSLNVNRVRDWYAVLAEISPFATSFPFRYDLYVTLTPDVPGNYTTVQNLSATFFVSGP